MRTFWNAAQSSICAVALVCLMALAPANAQDEVEPEALAAAEELVDAANMDQMLDTILPLFSEQIVNLVLQVKPELKGKFEPLVEEFLKTALTEGRDEFMRETAKLYARRMTTEEIKDVTAFYRTPTGKRLIEILPGLQVEAAQVGQKWGEKVARKAFDQLRSKLKEQGHEF